LKNSLIILCATFLLVGCAQNKINKTQIKKTEPAWILNPQIASTTKLAGSGCSKIHYKGIQAQKKLAISRAIEQIAIQKRVKIKSIAYRQKSTQNGQISSKVQSSSLQEIENISLSTHIKEIYTKDNGDICAWVIEK